MLLTKPAVVIDNGSYSTKVGFACDNHPVSMFRTVLGRPKYLNGSYGKEPYEVYIGEEAIERSDEYEINKPVINGRIVHWDNMERIWHHIFYRELKVAPEDRAVMLACSITASMPEKIKCCEVLFESLNVPALCIQPHGVLALYGSGYTTGISVDLGYDTADIIPIYEGGQVSYAHILTQLAGKQVSEYIKECFDNRMLDFGKNNHDVIEGIKRKSLYITQDLVLRKKDYFKKYILPDGKEIDVGWEAFMAAEILFQPDKVVGRPTNFMPLQDAVTAAAMKCDEELRSEMYEAVVPFGGLSMIPGLCDRLATEIEKKCRVPVNVISSPEAYAVAWLGGTTLAGLSDATKLWLTKKQFEEHGAKIVKNKFL